MSSRAALGLPAASVQPLGRVRRTSKGILHTICIQAQMYPWVGGLGLIKDSNKDQGTFWPLNEGCGVIFNFVKFQNVPGYFFVKIQV